MQTSAQTKNLWLTIPQANFLLTDPREAVLIWGRRSGKSFIALAVITVRRALDMPGACFLLMGATYSQLLERTFAAMKSGWAYLGYFEDVHYVVGKKPPKHFAKSRYIPSNYKHVVTWYTGTSYIFGSQDREGLTNSLTVYGLFADEAKFLDEGRFKEDALPTVSAPTNHFPDSPHNRTIIIASSMPALPSGQWLLDYQKQSDNALNDVILKASLTIQRLKNKLAQTENIASIANLKSQISILESETNILRKNCVYYSEVSSLANIGTIGIDYIKQQQRILKDRFKTEILNLRPETKNAFYIKLKEKHMISLKDYSAYDNGLKGCLTDRYDLNSPLSIGIDFGAVFNCIVTAQVIKISSTITFLAEHFLKGADGYIIDDVVNKWCDYYAAHKNKKVDVYYDAAGNNRTGVTRITPAEQVIKILQSRGWQAIAKTQRRANELHSVKMQLINTALDESDPRLLRIIFNKANMTFTIDSMRGAMTIENRGKIQKDKSSEKKNSIDPQKATHLSDAVDALLIGVLADNYTGDDQRISLIATMQSMFL